MPQLPESPDRHGRQAMTAGRPNPAPGASLLGVRVDSRQLLGEAHELVILHGGVEYRLRQTSQGKLILTK